VQRRTLALQQAYLHHVWPQLTCQIRRGLLVCRGTIRPNPLTREYAIRLEYQLGSSPKIWIESPPLERRSPDEKIPHIYSLNGERPCLYYPKSDEWRADKWLAETVMPWALLWLLFYEIWLATGEWLGEGVEHNGPK
jgi:hypothetical protein